MSPAARCIMVAYLKLTDAEWEAIRPYLPPQRSGPRRKRDRETVTAFLFAQAAGVSLDSLPDCGFPSGLTLRTTWQRWRASGELSAVMAAGSTAAARMAWQYRHRITDLSLRQRPPNEIGRRSATMPRWTHVRGA
jgi:transposase